MSKFKLIKVLFSPLTTAYQGAMPVSFVAMLIGVIAALIETWHFYGRPEYLTAVFLAILRNQAVYVVISFLLALLIGIVISVSIGPSRLNALVTRLYSFKFASLSTIVLVSQSFALAYSVVGLIVMFQLPELSFLIQWMGFLGPFVNGYNPIAKAMLTIPALYSIPFNIAFVGTCLWYFWGRRVLLQKP